jgi:hypothetical protein
MIAFSATIGGVLTVAAEPPVLLNLPALPPTG